MSSGTVTSSQQVITDIVRQTGSEDCGAKRGAHSSFLSRSCQRLVLSRLNRLQNGRICLDDQNARFVVGENSQDDLTATITVKNPRFYRRLLTGSDLGLAEAYLDGDFECDDLTNLFRIFCRNLDWYDTSGRTLDLATRAAARVGYWLARNTRSGSRRNIGAHYDLGNEFFELFLDPSMMYSSAIFDDANMSLADAQIARLDETCRRLQLKASDHLLEIGTGWGGFALHAAKNFGCRVTTTTISENQFRYAQQRIAAAGLSDRVTVLQQDYRDLTGTYDKLVSLEMIEAVGPQFYDQYFSKCASLLHADGRMLLQAIVMPEQRYSQYLKSVDFIQKYIFPGGCLPSVTAMQNSMTRNSRLRLLSMDDFAEGYARTLREWRRNFLERLDDVRQLGYSERFIRMWDYYLTYCEGAFAEKAVGVVQAVWGR
ncbi:MAG: class I SAM-dependent methyltransferase [Fuerstia sp.]|nr:class I SAM-dependent methyltransferase [Fuerstiella sp.]